MRIGILIIGSLFWDPSRVRCRWRQERLGCGWKRVVTAPIRYGKKARKRGNTYTMVFARSCSEPARLGRALAVPVLADCREPEHLLYEAQCLWAAERDVEQIEGISAEWGKVCILKNPRIAQDDRILRSWFQRIGELRAGYTALPTAQGEDALLDPATGFALFEWPTDTATNQALGDFDLLLMTATRPSLVGERYPTAAEIASAWRVDTGCNVMYFYNNRHCGITTFEDDAIQAILSGDRPVVAPEPPTRA
jgi:hypothetical protein